jgi:hypothetical protein
MMHTHADSIIWEITMVDTHTDAHGSFSWLLKYITEQIYDNYGRDYYQVCIQGFIQRYLQLGFVPRENTYRYIVTRLKHLTSQI